MDDDEVDGIEKQLNARTFAKFKKRYISIIESIRNIFKGNKLDVKPSILKLSSQLPDDSNVTVFCTDEAFIKICSIDELFIQIKNYCNVYDYELLIAFVESTECQEAINLLDDFTKEIQSSVLSDLDLLGDDGELRDPNYKDFMDKTHDLVIKHVGGKCTLKTKGLIQNIICERFHLKKGSIFFKGVQVDSVNFVYQISHAVKGHIQQFPITAKNIFSEEEKIKCLIIDGEEVKFPAQLEG